MFVRLEVDTLLKRFVFALVLVACVVALSVCADGSCELCVRSYSDGVDSLRQRVLRAWGAVTTARESAPAFLLAVFVPATPGSRSAGDGPGQSPALAVVSLLRI